MRIERFLFGLLAVCMILGAAVGGVLVGMDGFIGGTLVGALSGTMVAVSLISADTSE